MVKLDLAGDWLLYESLLLIAISEIITREKLGAASWFIKLLFTDFNLIVKIDGISIFRNKQATDFLALERWSKILIDSTK